MSDYLMIRLESFRLKAFSSSNRGKATVVKLELETSDADALSYLLYELQQARNPKKPAQPSRAATSDAMLALPAPQLRLPAPKGGRGL